MLKVEGEGGPGVEQVDHGVSLDLGMGCTWALLFQVRSKLASPSSMHRHVELQKGSADRGVDCC